MADPVQVVINGHSYTFRADVLSDPGTRNSYFRLADASFGLKLDAWYGFGFWDHTFIPYVLFDGDQAVSSVAVCLNEVWWRRTKKMYAQISTVMTLPRYRRQGLSRWLMTYALNEWKGKCHSVYLLANDSAIGFYPKFGFEAFTEYAFTVPVHSVGGTFRKMDLYDAGDLDLVIHKYGVQNPFAELKVRNLSEFLFHCVTWHPDDIYYLEVADAVVIIKRDQNKLICYDILTAYRGRLNDIIGVFAGEQTEYACLGFMPVKAENAVCVPSREEDTHLFVLPGKENIFKDNRVMLPLLSRA